MKHCLQGCRSEASSSPYETGRVLVAAGLQDGDLIVAQGGQLLYPGQRVEVAAVQAAADAGLQP